MGVPDIPAHGGARRMYKTAKEQQLTFDGFNQSCGMKLNPKDEYVILADMIDWAAVEAEYSALFKSRRGRPAASARMALGSLIIQKRANLSDRRLVREIARNVSYQYFLGLQSFQRTSPVKHGVLPEFRKRLGKDFLVKVNEIFLKRANSTPAHAGDKPESPAANGNMGTMILDATCSPSNIRFPQDFSLLNEARVKLDAMIDRLHDPASGKRRPRTYRKVLRKRYLAHAKSRKRTAKQTRSIVRVMLCAVKRNMAFVDGFLEKGGFLEDRDEEVPCRDLVFCPDERITIGRIAGNRIGTVLGTPDQRGPARIRHVGDVLRFRPPTDEEQQAVHRIGRLDLLLADFVLLMNLVLHDIRTHVRFAAVILPHRDTSCQDCRSARGKNPFLHAFAPFYLFVT